MTADQLERELAIRKMELDAEQLERLHKLDAERARQEEERRKALEVEQPGAAAPASAPESAGAAAEPQQEPVPVAPELPPGEASGAAVAPAVPGQEAQVIAPQAGDAPAGELAPVTPDGTAAPAPQGTYRPRRAVRRQLPAGEQVLRALQNSTN
jgi:hypothetical protein